jgi:predicted amidophosphoribosyltransferase
MAQVEALTLQRERTNRQTRCPGCGSAQGAQARFCSNCGRAMQEALPVTEYEDDEEYCDSCGAMRQGESKYCAVCGAAFVKEAESLPVKADAPAQAKPEPLEEPEFIDME